jgi:uncharacterized protein (TIGR02001 family)
VRILLFLALVPVLAASIPAAEPTHGFSGSIALASDYVYRGLTQSGGRPALQASVDWAHAGGWYAGSSLSNVSWYEEQNAGTVSAPVALSSGSNSNAVEVDLYGGFKRAFFQHWSLEAGAIRYWYPGRYDNVGAYRKPDTTEVYAAAGYRWVALKYSKAVSEHAFGTNESRGAMYLDLSATVPVGEGLSLLLHAGRQRYPNKANTGYFGASGGDNAFYTYTDYKVGVSKAWRNLMLALAWTRADSKATAPDDQTTIYRNVHGENIGGSRVAATVTYGF